MLLGALIGLIFGFILALIGQYFIEKEAVNNGIIKLFGRYYHLTDANFDGK